METSLDQLARLAMISFEYKDKMGNIHPTSNETKLKLLEAIGYDVSSDKQIKKSLVEIKKDYYDRLLPKVRVIRKGLSQNNIELYLKEAEFSQKPDIKIEITTENNETIKRSINSSELKLKKIVKVENQNIAVMSLPIQEDIEFGYHTICVELLDKSETTSLIITPSECYFPKSLGSKEDFKKIWGIPLQLYSLQSKENWGVGDFSDLVKFSKICAKLGADIIGLNPINALFPADYNRCSPYSCSDRKYINYIYIDVSKIDDFIKCNKAQEFIKSNEFINEVEKAKNSEFVDYETVGKLKQKGLKIAYEYFLENHLDENQKPKTKRGEDYIEYVKANGKHLEELAIFNAVSDHMAEKCLSWGGFDEAFKDPNSKEVQEFIKNNQKLIGLYKYHQWIAEKQFMCASNAAKNSGMRIGLYIDQPVGIAGDSSITWWHRENYGKGFSVGAPADLRRPRGQSWGFAPQIPKDMYDKKFQDMIDIMRANMSLAGAIRIDHVMSLQRLFWTPIYNNDDGPITGAYMNHPFDELLGIMALESHRNEALVIGEDLGTVPDGFRDKMFQAGVIASKVLHRTLEKDGSYTLPENYFPYALAMSSTHDQPPIISFWKAKDLELFFENGLLLSEEQFFDMLEKRVDARKKLVEAMNKAQTWETQSKTYELSLEEEKGEKVPEGLTKAVIAFMSKTKSFMYMPRLVELCKMNEMENVPGTNDFYSNWRVKTKLDIDEIEKDNFIKQAVEILNNRKE